MRLHYRAGVSGDTICVRSCCRLPLMRSRTDAHPYSSSWLWPPACHAGASFSLYFAEETRTLTYSKWCVSGGPRRLALPPHLKRACLYFTSLTGNRWYFAIFVIVSCPVAECLRWRGTSAPGWKTGFKKFAPFGYQPKQRHLGWLQSSFGLQRAASKSQTEVKFFARRAGKRHGIAGRQVIGFTSGHSGIQEAQRGIAGVFHGVCGTCKGRSGLVKLLRDWTFRALIFWLFNLVVIWDTWDSLAKLPALAQE